MCVRVKAIKIARAIGVSRPEHHVAITQVGDTWSIVQRRMNKFREAVRTVCPDWQDVYTVEPNPNGSRHVHMWQWGGSIERWSVSEIAASLGMGTEAYVEPRRVPAGRPLTYGLKIVLGGSPHGESLPPMTWDYLEMNGHRLVHSTARFWRDSSGRSLPGVKAAVAALRSRPDRPIVAIPS